MQWHDYVRERLSDITGDAARDEEIVEELAQHLAQRYDEARQAGAPHERALAMATGELRERAQIARLIREADRPRPHRPMPPASRRVNMLSDLWLDVRYAGRLLRRTPGFTAAAVLTLALGIGVTMAIFNVIDTVLLRTVPYPESQRLVMLWETDRASGTEREPASFPDFIDFKARSRTLDRIGAFMPVDANLQPDQGDPMRVAGLAVTPEIPDILGIRTIVGRAMSAADDQPQAPATALISQRLWRTAYGGRDLVGRTIRINDRVRTVIGVVPANADFGVVQILAAADYGGGTGDPRMQVDVWIPLQGDSKRFPRTTHPTLLAGRLAPGVVVSAAQDELAKIAADLEEQYRADNDKRGVSIQLVRDVVFGPVEPPLLLLMAAVALILLMACANVANLLLTRSTRRLREVAVRSALGAETMRLVRQFVAENVVLAMSAVGVAFVLAFGVLRTLVAIAPADIPRIAAIGLDMRSLLVGVGCAGVIALLFSLVPVAQARWTALPSLLKSEERVTGGVDARRLRSVLVIAEVALAVVLVTGAGLLIKSFWQLRTTDPGFQVASTLKLQLQLPQSRYPIQANPMPTSAAIERFNRELLQRVASLPGVQKTALAANHPLDRGFASSFIVVGREAEGANWPEISIRRVSPDYFAALGVPLVRGRLLDDRDRLMSSRGVVINRAVMDRFFPSADPVGHQIGFWGMPWTIVGVVGSERFQGIAKDPPIAVYLPLDLVPSNVESVLVRTAGDLSTLASAVRAVVRELDPAMVVYGVEPLEETLAESLIEQRFLMTLLAALAALALALAAVGIHGVLTCNVAQQRREIGVRMALGADGHRVLRGVVAQGVRLTGVGLIMGFAAAIAMGRFLTGLLFGVTPTDVPTLVAVIAVLGAVAAFSIWLPARRAVRVDPLVALRQE
jgi:putative ABC transport system permease protein